MYNPVGYIDFYPNGGADQPGCEMLNFPVVLDRFVRNLETMTDLSQLGQTAGNLFICSHMRAIEYYLESIPVHRTALKCHFESVRCKSWFDFVDGQCPNNNTRLSDRAQMGFNSFQWAAQLDQITLERRTPRKYFVRTNSHFPYCKAKK